MSYILEKRKTRNGYERAQAWVVCDNCGRRYIPGGSHYGTLTAREACLRVALRFVPTVPGSTVGRVWGTEKPACAGCNAELT